MKKQILFLFWMLLPITAVSIHAEQVSKQEALLKAQQFMPNRQFGEVKAFARGEKVDSPAEYETFYIFNAEGKKGFVIVSGDDRTEPILGYSNRGSLNPDSVPDNVKGLLNYYEKVLAAIANDKNYTRPARTRGAEGRAKVETLMATEWGQEFPYNVKCPIVNGQRSVTGCVATALAQVLNYNRWPKDYTSAVPAYTTYSKQIYMPQLEPTKFGWGSVSLQFLGTLMLYCGQAVQMNYGVDESSANTSIIPEILKNIFGYNNESQFVMKENYTDEEWDNLMYAEMAGGRPVIYSGFGEQMTGNSGHAFVIDGYESGRYHVNWGWDGDSNGLFQLTGLNVTGGSYNESQTAVIGIQSPESTIKSFKPKAQVGAIIHEGGKYFWRQNDGKFPAINIESLIYGTTLEKENLQLGWGLFNKSGLVSVYAQEQQEISPDRSEYYDYKASIVIADDVADGDYTLLPISRSNESEEWVADAPNTEVEGQLIKYYTEIRITNNLLKLVYGSSSTVFERNNHGYMIKDGITIDLWQEYDDYYATVISPQSGNFSGNIVLPDIVSCNSVDYRIYDADFDAFKDCQNLTSLSTSMYHGPQLENCPNLANVEFREGVTVYENQILNCPALNSLEFPTSLSYFTSFPFVYLCENLESIKFKSNDQLFFTFNPFYGCSPADIYFLSIYPPTMGSLDDYINNNVKIHIPKGSMSEYRNSVWKDWNLTDDLITENTNQIKWGYYIDHDVSHYGSQGIGSIERYDVDLAIHVPAEMLEKYKNQKISGIEFYCEAYGKETIPDYVFITKPGTDYLIKQPVKISQIKGWKSVMLSEPFIITGDELYIGIGRESYLDFCTSMNEPNEYDGQWCRIMGNSKEWENQYNDVIGHPLTLRFIIEGENLPKDLRLCQPKLVNEDSKNIIQASVVNRCTELLTSYTIKWDFDGKVNGTKTIETCLASSMAETMSIDIPSDLEGYHHTLTLDVVSVNGEEDAIQENSHLVYEFIYSANHYPRTMVLENFVGTWCGWSPRGYSVVEKMYEKYPDSFISIGVHENTTYGTDDAVGEPYNYKTYIETYTSTPTFLVNRVKTIDTTPEETIKAYEEQEDNADAMIIANAVFTSEAKTSVTVKTASTFGFNDDGNANFRIGYVVVEDNVGPYDQANFYSDFSRPDDPDDYMNEWYKKGSPVKMKFNDVARGIYPGLNGLEGSVPTSVEKGKAYEYEYTFDLPDNIQDKKDISIVTLLIDNKSGEIMNADKTNVITETNLIGDANNDGMLNDKDLDAVVHYIMTGDIKGFNFKNADLNNDNKVNVADIVKLNGLLAPND